MRRPVKLPDLTAQSLTLTRHFTCARVTTKRTDGVLPLHQVVVGEVVCRKCKAVAELHCVVAENAFGVSV